MNNQNFPTHTDPPVDPPNANFFSELISIIVESGFELAGIARAQIPLKDKENILEFCNQSLYGSMDWYPQRNPIRLDFQNLGFIVQSVLVLGMVYHPKKEWEEWMEAKGWKGRVSKYAWGKDYHKVLKKKAKPILEFLREKFPNYKFRQGVDSLPIPEKVLAREAGLGWIGKNTMLIHPELGSYFFLTVILCEVDLHEWVHPMTKDQEKFLKPTNLSDNPRALYFFQDASKDRCGNCRACLDACPTGALFEPYKIHAGLCISHHTIEYRKETFPEGMETHGWVFGCDICQDVCPWNRVKARKKKVTTQEDDFQPLPLWSYLEERALDIPETDWDKLTYESPLKRIGLVSWLRNVRES